MTDFFYQWFWFPKLPSTRYRIIDSNIVNEVNTRAGMGTKKQVRVGYRVSNKSQLWVRSGTSPHKILLPRKTLVSLAKRSVDTKNQSTLPFRLASTTGWPYTLTFGFGIEKQLLPAVFKYLIPARVQTAQWCKLNAILIRQSALRILDVFHMNF